MLGVDAGCELVYNALLVWKAVGTIAGWFMKNPDKANMIANKVGNEFKIVL